jgi:haloacetate dehalogenase
MGFFDGFALETIDTGTVKIRLRRGGQGAPLLLLHGNPQTHAMWHKVAPALAAHFTVIAADLTGYGGSSKPQTDAAHTPYSKRAMAADQVAVMAKLGFDRFLLAGHDRGGRVAYRMALDHPDKVLKLVTLDILPTYEHFKRTDMKFAMGYWHWFFLAQPFDVPEHMMSADPDWYWHRQTSREPKGPDFFAPDAREDYLKHFRDPATIHAICEDYRAGATIDMRIDEADYGKKKITCPMLALWGDKGLVAKWYDVLAVWRDWAVDVRGRAMPSGHYIPEEAPAETLAEFLAFFKGGGPS